MNGINSNNIKMNGSNSNIINMNGSNKNINNIIGNSNFNNINTNGSNDNLMLYLNTHHKLHINNQSNINDPTSTLLLKKYMKKGEEINNFNINKLSKTI